MPVHAATRSFTHLVLRLRQLCVQLVKNVLYRKPQHAQAYRTVLVFRTGRLGDFLNAIPAMHILRSRLAGTRIVLVTTASSDPAMQVITKSYADPNSLPWLEFVVPSLVDRAVSFVMSGYADGLQQVRKVIHEEQPDAIFVLPYFGEVLTAKLRKLLFFRLAGFSGPIFGFDGFASRGILRRNQYELGLYEHEVFGPVRAISECPDLRPVAESEIVLNVAVPQAATLWARKVIEESCFSDSPLVAIGPGATYPHKIWPTDRYIEVCRELRRKYSCRFVVVGIQSDSAIAARLHAEFAADCLDTTGRTSVAQLAALLSFCVLFVGNDSGPAHVASAVGCPCVTVTSALDFPGIWEPWNSRGRVARVRIGCEFCLSLTHCPLGTNECILAVESRQVLRMCNDVIQLRSVLPSPISLGGINQ